MTAMGDALRPLLEKIEAKHPTPGGGAVAAWSGAMGCALAGMVVAYSVDREPEHEDALRNAQRELATARALLMELAEEDAAAYADLSAALKIPKDDPTRPERLAPAVRRAVEVPRIVGATGFNVLRVLEGISTICNPYLRSDLGVAAAQMEASIRGAAWMIQANLPLLKDATERRQLDEETREGVRHALDLRASIDRACHASSS